MKFFNSMYRVAIMLTANLIIVSCSSFLTIDPPADQIDASKAFSSDEIALGVIRGLYASLHADGSFASGSGFSVNIAAGRSADEFVDHSIQEIELQFSRNNILPSHPVLRSSLWQGIYRIIYGCNIVLENLPLSVNVSDDLKRELRGEALFIRSFCHFYLTNLFGRVPLILTTDYRINANAYPSNQKEIYEQLIADLSEAKGLLSESYPSGDRIRVNKWAAAGLLARVYLYHHQWPEAESEASEIIGRRNLYQLEPDLNRVFLKDSREAIFQLSSFTSTPLNTREGHFFILDASPSPVGDVSLSNDLLDAFEQGDGRYACWVSSFSVGETSWKFPFKYKVKNGSNPLTEYSMVMRLAEQYLIRAEARIQQNSINEGISDLNVLRNRARTTGKNAIQQLPDLPMGLNKTSALLAVAKERRVELFSEWGHRWLDLKRTDRADEILGRIKGKDWQPTDVLYPIPETDILNNSNLSQNTGYDY